jgi:hypothetical protein
VDRCARQQAKWRKEMTGNVPSGAVTTVKRSGIASGALLVVVLCGVHAAGLTASARQGSPPLAPLVLPAGFQADVFAARSPTPWAATGRRCTERPRDPEWKYSRRACATASGSIGIRRQARCGSRTTAGMHRGTTCRVTKVRTARQRVVFDDLWRRCDLSVRHRSLDTIAALGAMVAHRNGHVVRRSFNCPTDSRSLHLPPLRRTVFAKTARSSRLLTPRHDPHHTDHPALD